MKAHLRTLITSILSTGLFVMAASAQHAIDFEAPTYTAGITINGQDSWTMNRNFDTSRILTASQIADALTAAGLNPGLAVQSGSQALLASGVGDNNGTIRVIGGLSDEDRVVFNASARPVGAGTSGLSLGNIFFAIENSANQRSAMIRFGYTADGDIRSIDYGTPGQVWVPSGQTWDEDTWYHFTADINYSTQTYDFYINGTKINADPIGFAQSPDRFHQVRIFRGASQAGMIVDDLSVSTPGRKVAWVSFHGADSTPSGPAATAGFTYAPDVDYTRLLRANGHIVTRYVSTATPDTTFLNRFDVVITSRSVPSTHYQSVASRTLWHGLTVPSIYMSGYNLRTNRLGFTTGNAIPDTAGPIRLAVNSPAHPIFSGVPLDAGNVTANLYATSGTNGGTIFFNGIIQKGISVNLDPLDGGGTVLATVAPNESTNAVGGMIIAEWEAGAPINTTNSLAGRRLVFLSGTREDDDLTSEGAGIYDLTPDGAQIFLNAVDYMGQFVPRRELFWSETGGFSGPGLGAVYSAAFDGSGKTAIAMAVNRPIGLALDVANGHIYVAEDGFDAEPQQPSRIVRTDFDGSSQVVLFDQTEHGFSNAQMIALDLANGHVYWTDYHLGVIRGNLDGTGYTVLGTLGGAVQHTALDLDLANGHIYFADPTQNGVLFRMDLDGQNGVELARGLADVNWRFNSIALDVPNGHIYYTDAGTHEIKRMDLNGSNQTPILTDAGLNPYGIVLRDDAQLYWVGGVGQRLGTANVDGVSNVNLQLVSTTGATGFGIAVVPAPPSVIQVTGISIEGSTITISWEGGAGPFQLRRRGDLVAGDWENVGEPTMETQATDTVGAATMFYQVQGN